MITVLCGGVGAARFLRALALVVPPEHVTGVVNTGDDAELHGLMICPDLDTIIYTLADAIDPDRGWGLRDESWRAMAALARFAPVTPPSSSAGATWFGLGDQDLATHLYRTGRRAEGATLSTITTEISKAWGVRQRLLPMTNDNVATIVHLADGATVSFQEYFVKLRHDVAVRAVEFAGSATAALLPEAQLAITSARAVVIAPSNPIVSLGPIRALAGVDAALAARRDTVVAISPIVGGLALKGPADRMLKELGLQPSVVGVAEMYAPIAGTLVIDPADAHLADDVRARGVTPVVCPSIMSVPGVAAELAATTLRSVGYVV